MGRIPDEDIQRVRDATDIISLISETVILKKKGRLYWGLCPFHGEKTPSFKVDPANQMWHCFGCDAGGDSFGFVMRTENVEFPDAVRILADRARIELHEEGESLPRGLKERLVAACEESADFYHKTLLSSAGKDAKAARDYLAARGFGSEVAKRFKLGYAPGRGVLVRHLAQAGFTAEEIVTANVGLRSDGGSLKDRFYERVMFPIHDLSGRTVGFGGRVIGDREPKYLNTQETPIFHKSRNLYGIDHAKSEIVTEKSAVVVEGYTDVIALHEAGIKNAVATLGTALTRQHVRLLGRFSSRIVYLFDADEAGLRAAERAAEFIDVSIAPRAGGSAIELEVAVVSDGKDPADYVATAGADALREVLVRAVPLMQFVLDRRLAQHDLDSAEGRARALADMATVLASVRGSLLEQDYSNYVADRLLTDYVTVQTATRQAKPAYAGEHKSSDDSKATKTAQGPVPRLEPHVQAERALVGLVAAVPSLRTKARGLLTSRLLTDEPSRRLLELVCDTGMATGSALTAAVLSADAAAGELLSGVLMEVGEGEDEGLVARELLKKLKELDLERQTIEKRVLMRALDEVKDKAAFDDIFKEIASLQLQRDTLRRSDGVLEDDQKAWG